MRVRHLITAAVAIAGLIALNPAPAFAEESPSGCPKGNVCFWRAGDSDVHYKTKGNERDWFWGVTDSAYGSKLWAFNNGYSKGTKYPAVAIQYTCSTRVPGACGNFLTKTECFENNPNGDYKGWIDINPSNVAWTKVLQIDWVEH